jgi:hypothetical protein
LYFPLSSIVDDLVVRAVLAKYVTLLAAGLILCDRNTGIIVTAATLLGLLTTSYFFAYPIQR